MKRHVLAGVCGWLLAAAVFAQQASVPLPKFEAADVHEAPYRSQPFANGGVMRGDRYIWHQATIVDLISAAYDIDADMVQGGPSWLERDRFEVVAKAPVGTPQSVQKQMLRALLVERFGLTMHQGDKAMPAYVLTVSKPGSTLMKENDGSGTEGCEPKDSGGPSQPGAPVTVACHKLTMTVFASMVRQMFGDYVDKPVVDATGLKGAWDFDLKWTRRGQLSRAGADGIPLFDALEKQLGLKLALETAPQHVWLVDNVSRKPTPNAANIAQALPPLPPAVFDVAVVKPSGPNVRSFARINGGQVNAQAIPLKFMVTFAWDLNPNSDDNIVGAPKWFFDDKFDVMAKVLSDQPLQKGARAETIDMEDLRSMVRALLAERFQMKTHMEDRPIPAYTLYAANPKMKPADPASRTKCYEGPGPDGKDPRTANPVLNRLLTCQNMTADQISEELQRVAGGYIYGPVLNRTELKGAYDFTLSFSSADRTNGLARSDSNEPSEPNGAMTLYDAVSRQLGLKLVKEKRPMPVLVIDSIQEKPTQD